MAALEQSIIMVLLLTGLLNARPKLGNLVKIGIALAILLAFIAPAVPLPVPRDLFSLLFIPLLLWQSAYRLANARWPTHRQDIVIWAVVASLIAIMLTALSTMHWSEGLLFGVLASSILWRAAEKDGAHPTHLGQIGMLSLAFLLAELAPLVESPKRYALGLAGGAALGVVVGYLFVHMAREWAKGVWVDVCSIAQAYVAYSLAIFWGLSGVAGGALSIVTYVAYGSHRGLWPAGIVRPQPLDSRPVYLTAVAALAFFGWQTHAPWNLVLLWESLLGLVITAVGIALACRYGSLKGIDRGTFAGICVSVGMQLLPALLLWPRDIHLSPLPLVLALGLAWLLTLGTRSALTPLLKVYTLLDTTPDIEIRQPDYLAGGILVKDVMSGEVHKVKPETPVSEVVKSLLGGSIPCILVTDTEGRLEGLITEHDLFIKPGRLPYTQVSYPSLFQEPVEPEHLPETYAEIAAKRTAAEVMNRQVIGLNENHSIRHAIRIMAEYGYDCLPVLSSASREKGKVVGILTRRDIIRAFSRGKGPA